MNGTRVAWIRTRSSGTGIRPVLFVASPVWRRPIELLVCGRGNTCPERICGIPTAVGKTGVVGLLRNGEASRRNRGRAAAPLPIRLSGSPASTARDGRAGRCKAPPTPGAGREDAPVQDRKNLSLSYSWGRPFAAVLIITAPALRIACAAPGGRARRRASPQPAPAAAAADQAPSARPQAARRQQKTAPGTARRFVG
jgi:hypothetical protein